MELPWLHWVFIVSFVVDSIAQVCVIGVPRKPITSGQAASNLVMNVALVLLLVFFK